MLPPIPPETRTMPQNRQNQHEMLVRKLAEFLVSRRFSDIRTIHPESDRRPAAIGGTAGIVEMPDATAMGLRFVLFEVETEESVTDLATRKRWRHFSDYAERNDAEFWVVVPKSGKEIAWKAIDESGINAKVMGM